MGLGVGVVEGVKEMRKKRKVRNENGGVGMEDDVISTGKIQG